MIGTWTTDGGSDVWTLSPDGSFAERWSKSNKELRFDGTWEVRDGALVATITNRSSPNTTNLAPVGTAAHFNIIGLNSTRMTLESDGQTNQWERKP